MMKTREVTRMGSGACPCHCCGAAVMPMLFADGLLSWQRCDAWCKWWGRVCM